MQFVSSIGGLEPNYLVSVVAKPELTPQSSLKQQKFTNTLVFGPKSSIFGWSDPPSPLWEPKMPSLTHAKAAKSDLPPLKAANSTSKMCIRASHKVWCRPTALSRQRKSFKRRQRKPFKRRQRKPFKRRQRGKSSSQGAGRGVVIRRSEHKSLKLSQQTNCSWLRIVLSICEVLVLAMVTRIV